MDIKAAASAYNQVANIAQNNPVADNIPASETSGPSFADLVNDALVRTVDTGRKAEDVSTLAMMGKADITDLATSVSKAELALNTVVAIRDKVISAYQQIMQMSI
ncbi:MAG TPA: flagellar hook-basal body complex protein FliE [Rickettsiales bacterium]|nr:flagellar hook-basal body complex protein FliE [Rickettsiales bacterium]